MIPWAFEMYFAFQTLVLYHSCFCMSITVLCVEDGKRIPPPFGEGIPFYKMNYQSFEVLTFTMSI